MAHLYLHIPFCAQRCGYCDFLTSTDVSLKSAYTKALAEELRLIKASYKQPLKTIFIGGGTPSLLNLKEMDILLRAINENFGKDFAEFTIEANPESVTEEKVKLWQEGGVTRVSCGMQAGQENLLTTLDRNSSYEQVVQLVDYLHKYGIERYNIDLIYGIPAQTTADLLASAKMVLDVGAKHISAYALKLEPRVKMAKKVAKGELLLPNDDIVADQLDALVEYLDKYDLKRYEISNFSLEGEESLHNLAYWRAYDTLGAGTGAVYKLSGKRYQNYSDIKMYIEAIENGLLPYDDNLIEALGIEEQIYEYIISNFRLARGLDTQEFQRLFNRDFTLDYADWLKKMQRFGVLEQRDDYFAFNNNGLNVSNYLLSEL